MMDGKGRKSCSQMDLNFMGVDLGRLVRFDFFCPRVEGAFQSDCNIVCFIRDFGLVVEWVLPVLEGCTRNCALSLWTVHFSLRAQQQASFPSHGASGICSGRCCVCIAKLPYTKGDIPCVDRTIAKGAPLQHSTTKLTHSFFSHNPQNKNKNRQRMVKTVHIQ